MYYCAICILCLLAASCSAIPQPPDGYNQDLWNFQTGFSASHNPSAVSVWSYGSVSLSSFTFGHPFTYGGLQGWTQNTTGDPPLPCVWMNSTTYDVGLWPGYDNQDASVRFTYPYNYTRSVQLNFAAPPPPSVSLSVNVTSPPHAPVMYQIVPYQLSVQLSLEPGTQLTISATLKNASFSPLEAQTPVEFAIMGLDLCAAVDCEAYGSNCFALNSIGSYLCECPIGHSGPNCTGIEYPLTSSFTENFSASSNSDLEGAWFYGYQNKSNTGYPLFEIYLKEQFMPDDYAWYWMLPLVINPQNSTFPSAFNTTTGGAGLCPGDYSVDSIARYSVTVTASYLIEIALKAEYTTQSNASAYLRQVRGQDDVIQTIPLCSIIENYSGMLEINATAGDFLDLVIDANGPSDNDVILVQAFNIYTTHTATLPPPPSPPPTSAPFPTFQAPTSSPPPSRSPSTPRPTTLPSPSPTPSSFPSSPPSPSPTSTPLPSGAGNNCTTMSNCSIGEFCKARPDGSSSCAKCAGDACNSCGDGVCNSSIGENSFTCQQDCRNISDFCGDGTCNKNGTENCINCPSDCGSCITSQTCAGDPPCNGNGTCVSGVCECYLNFTGVACDQQTQPINVTYNLTSPSIIITPVDSESVSFSISVFGIQEVAPNGTVFAFVSLSTQQFAPTNRSSARFDNSNLPPDHVLTSSLVNHANLTVSIWNFTKPTTFSFANQTLSFNSHSVKINLFIQNWPFVSYNNVLQVLFAQEAAASTANACQDSPIKDANGDIKSVQFQVDDSVLYSQFFSEAVLDGKYKKVSTLIPAHNTSFIAVQIPFFFDTAEVDPNFSVLLAQTSTPRCDDDVIHTKSGYRVVAMSVAVAIGGTAVIIGAALFAYKVHQKRKWGNRPRRSTRQSKGPAAYPLSSPPSSPRPPTMEHVIVSAQ